MSPSLNLKHNTYLENKILSSTNEELILLMLDGILKFNSMTKKNILDDNIEQKTININKSIAIFIELISTLNKDTKLFEYLNGLYSYQIKLLTEINILTENEKEKAIKKLDIVSNVVKELKKAYIEDLERLNS